jgi:hypothetical protein
MNTVVSLSVLVVMLSPLLSLEAMEGTGSPTPLSRPLTEDPFNATIVNDVTNIWQEREAFWKPVFEGEPWEKVDITYLQRDPLPNAATLDNSYLECTSENLSRVTGLSTVTMFIEFKEYAFRNNTSVTIGQLDEAFNNFDILQRVIEILRCDRFSRIKEADNRYIQWKDTQDHYSPVLGKRLRSQMLIEGKKECYHALEISKNISNIATSFGLLKAEREQEKLKHQLNEQQQIIQAMKEEMKNIHCSIAALIQKGNLSNEG